VLRLEDQKVEGNKHAAGKGSEAERVEEKRLLAKRSEKRNQLPWAWLGWAPGLQCEAGDDEEEQK
jgi:hypothetical protein